MLSKEIILLLNLLGLLSLHSADQQRHCQAPSPSLIKRCTYWPEKEGTPKAFWCHPTHFMHVLSVDLEDKPLKFPWG